MNQIWAPPEIPQPPVDMVMPPNMEALFNLSQIPFLVIVFYIAYRHWKEQKSFLFLYFLIGGAISSFFEPIVDVPSLVWYPLDTKWVLFNHVWGRVTPLFFIPIYTWFMGGQALYAYTRMEKGITSKGVWGLYGIFVIMNFISECSAHYTGVYAYYGNQPFVIFGLPLWMPMLNALIPITAAAMIYRLKPFLAGWKLASVIVTIPMADAFCNFGLGWPTTTALNSGVSLLGTHIATLIELVFCLIWGWWLWLAVGKDSPMDVVSRIKL